MVIVFEQTQIAVERLRSEYLEMPGLSLTGAQAARLMGLERPVAVEVLRRFEQSGFLACTEDGRFVHRDTTVFRCEPPGIPDQAQAAACIATSRMDWFVKDWFIAPVTVGHRRALGLGRPFRSRAANQAYERNIP